MKPPRPKKCQHCREPFTPSRVGQKVCAPSCGLALAKVQRAKKEKKERREKLTRLKTRSEWMKEAQAAFNRYIRLRDKDKPCICCGLPLSAGEVGGSYDCGHYRSIGSAPHLRFDPRNAHSQRKQCNRWGSGRAVDYRLGLIERIGLTEVESLEADQTVRKWTIPELQEIKRHYTDLARKV